MTTSLDILEIYQHYTLLFFTLVLFIGAIYKIYRDMPEEENISREWLLIPSTILHKVFSSVFGRHDGTIKTLITFRSVAITFLISITANIMCVSLILSSSPEEFNVEIKTISLYFSSYVVFLFFNFLGDFVSISFTRHVLYKVSEKKLRLRKYIFQDFIGIFLGYTISMLPIIFLILLHIFSISSETINSFKEYGILGPIFIPFLLLIFSTSSTVPMIFIILTIIALFSIAIPTFLFITTILLIQIMSKTNLTQYGFYNLIMKFSKIIVALMSFTLILTYLLKVSL